MIKNEIFKIKNKSGKLIGELYSTKDIVTEKYGESLYDFVKNVDLFLNDPTINRLLKENSNSIQKSMVQSITKGYGTSAGYYIIKGESVVSILNRQLKNKNDDLSLENKKDVTNEDVISKIKSHISVLSDYILYFSRPDKVDKMFLINGQHRFQAIKTDLKQENGINHKSRENLLYAPIEGVFNEVSVSEEITSLWQLKHDLLSEDSTQRFEWSSDMSIEDRTLIYENYLKGVKVEIIEVKDAVNFNALSKFIWVSNSSTEWDEFIYMFMQSFSSFRKWFGENCMGESTSELTDFEELFYKSPVSFGNGTFKRSAGGWQYLVSTIVNTCYHNSRLLSKFEVSSKEQIIKSLVSDETSFDFKNGEEFMRDSAKIIAVLNHLSTLPNYKMLKDFIEKPNFLIYIFFAKNYFTKVYEHSYNNKSYKPVIADDDLRDFIISLVGIFRQNSSWAHPDNTNFWNTKEGIDKLNEWKTKKAYTNSKTTQPLFAKDLKSEFQDEWVDIERACEKNETKDIDKSFRRHLVSDLLTWGSDHSCVVRKIIDGMEEAFNVKMIRATEAKIPFASLSWKQTNKLPSATKLVSSDFGDFYDSVYNAEETDRIHETAHSKGGSNTYSNIQLGNRKINRNQKAVV